MYTYELNKGDIVRILRTGKLSGEYYLSVGKLGVVVESSNKYARVKFKDLNNPYSHVGHFYYKLNEVEVVKAIKVIKNTREGEIMDNLKIDYDAVVDVVFIDGYNTKKYSYKYYGDKVVEKGDLVITDGKSLAKVVNVVDAEDFARTHSSMPYAEIAAVVDLSDYIKRQQTKARKSQLKKAMDIKIEKLQKDHVYEMFAEYDDDLKALFEEYKSL